MRDVSRIESMNVAEDPDAVVEVINASASTPVLLVCEHASNNIPPAFDQLGLSDEVVKSHVAWDPGALAVAQAMSSALDAPVVASRISRLVYDCNRPPTVPSAMPARSEIYDIPGNTTLTEEERQRRVEQYYQPFRDRLCAVIDRHLANGLTPVLVTVHSFTRVYNGVSRDVDIGILHDEDQRLADELLGGELAQSRFDVRRNEPYGPQDGVTHTLREHALKRGLLNVMIEIRNDLIADAPAQKAMAQLLTDGVRAAVETLQQKSQTQDSAARKTNSISHG